MKKISALIKIAIEQAKSNEKVKKALGGAQQNLLRGLGTQSNPAQTKDSEKKKKASGGKPDPLSQFNSPVDQEQIQSLINSFKSLKKKKESLKDIEVYLKFALDEKPSLVIKKQKLEEAEKIKRILDDATAIPSDYKEKT